MSLSGSTGALRQARARTKGKARAYPRRARSDLQRIVGNVEGKKVFLRLQRDVRHDIDPFVSGARPKWKWQRLVPGAACRVDYFYFGIVSSFKKLAPGTDVLSVP